MEFTATARVAATKQSWHLPAKDPKGEDCQFIELIECVGVPSLTEKNKEHDVNLIGIVGRKFLQFVHLEIDGANGKLKLLLGD